jgi:hypothetical protein
MDCKAPFQLQRRSRNGETPMSSAKTPVWRLQPCCSSIPPTWARPYSPRCRARKQASALTDRRSRWGSGSLSRLEAAELLGMSERIFWRWRDRFKQAGKAGLLDRRLGRGSGRAVPDADREEIELACLEQSDRRG